MTDRAVSDVIGYVLVFSLVSLTVGVVSVAGVGALQDARDVEQANNAERAFDVLGDNVEDVYRDGVPSRATEMSLAGAGVSTTTTATINVSGWSGSTLNFTTGDVTSNVVVWEPSGGSQTKIVYAFGTVFRSQADGGVVTRAGPFQFDTDRTILPVVNTWTRESQRYSEGTIRVRTVGGVPSVGYRGDAQGMDHLWLNVTTEHPDVWSSYLDARDGTSCAVEAGPAGPAEDVECELVGGDGASVRDELYVTLHPLAVTLER